VVAASVGLVLRNGQAKSGRSPRHCALKLSAGWSSRARERKNRSDILSRIYFVLFLIFFPTRAFSIDKPISSLAPEFQEAAQKRRAELARQTFCREKAIQEKVLRRDLASFVLGCMDEVEKAEQAVKK
jgi:hypothetical protein